jgi:hypothetical protein
LFIVGCSNDEEPIVVENPPESKSVISIIEDNFEGIQLVIIGSDSYNFIVSYNCMLDGQVLTFEPLQSAFPTIMKDNEGNLWDIFGYAVEGPRMGQKLSSVNSGMGYWFAFNTLYPGAGIYGEPDIQVNRDSILDSWLIPTATITQGTGLGAIPALSDVDFLEYDPKLLEDTDFYLEDDDLVIGYRSNREIRAYPHNVLNWHEVVNDQFLEQKIAVTFCPLTGTAKVWNRQMNGETLSIGVSGLVFNSNLLPYDLGTQSIWTQLDARCVKGEKQGTRIELLPHIETTWETWLAIRPIGKVISEETPNKRDYRKNPYGNYSETDLIAYPLEYMDERLPLKERVHAVIINDKVRVYRFSHFE